MPTGTGKTVCLLALLTSYLTHRTKYKKVTFTHHIVDILHTYRSIDVKNPKINKIAIKKTFARIEKQ